MTAPAPAVGVAQPVRVTVRKRRIRPRRLALYAFLIFMCVTWLFPLLWAVIAALRPYSDTSKSGGYFKLAREPFLANFSFDNFVNAWNQGNFATHYLNTIIVTIPAVILTLFIASMVAFSITRFSWRFNLLCLMLFTAGNLLPPQILIVPLYQIFLLPFIPPPLSDNKLLYDQFFGLIFVNVVFQMGFCIFVLSNYMKTISKELTEAALADGAPVYRIYWSVILPLCRPALAALATLEFTFIYNDFFWALFLMKSGDRRPITSALQNLQGQFFTDTNLLAAGSLLAAIPTILVYIALQKHFISGLTLGSTKG